MSRPQHEKGRESGARGAGDAQVDIEEGCRQAEAILEAGLSPHGLLASAALPHYAAIWTRDVAFAALGANLSENPAVVEAVASSLRTLSALQAPSGQMPVAYWPEAGYWDFHESGCTDATCLYIVAATQHLAAHPNPDLQDRLEGHLARAAAWLAAQDANQFTLIDSPSGGDWMDSTLQRAGKLLYVNVLYQRALAGLAGMGGSDSALYAARAELLRGKVDLLFWPEATPHEELLEGVPAAGASSGPGKPGGAGRSGRFPHPIGPRARLAAVRRDRGHYLSHVDGCRYVDECDVLGNVLAVLYGVAASERARRIMEFLHASPGARPYPMRTYTRSFEPGDRWGMYRHDLEEFQDGHWRNPPGRYHNGGVWPFIGGLYVAALHQVGMTREAKAEMGRLTAANRLSADPGREWGFHEWIDARTGEPGGAPAQSWSAGAYLLAAQMLRAGEVHL